MWQTKYALADLKIWEWELIFGRAVKAISSPGVRSPWLLLYFKIRSSILTIQTSTVHAPLSPAEFMLTFLCLLHKLFVIFTALDFKPHWEKIQAAAYNGVLSVDKKVETMAITIFFKVLQSVFFRWKVLCVYIHFLTYFDVN